MTYGPNNTISSYLPIEFQIEGEEDFVRELIAERERLTASIVNIKENGNYETLEMLTAQQWFSVTVDPTPRKTRYTFRKVINFGALPNAATKSVPHGINVTASTIFTRIYATATNPNTGFVPIPFVNVLAPADGIEIYVDPVNVNIVTTTANWVGYTICYVVLEYIK